jgi:signal transduction histidine kinase
VSVTTSAASARKRLPRKSHGPISSIGARLLMAVVVLTDLIILTLGAALGRQEILQAGIELGLWTVAAAAVGLVAIEVPSGQQLGMDMPILLAAGFLFGPVAAGIVAFAGYVDVREFRGQISLERALFNRAQTSLSVVAAVAVFSALGFEVDGLPASGLGAVVAVSVDWIVNWSFIAGILALQERISPLASLRRLRVGAAYQFVMTYAAFGLQSLVLAHVYMSAGPWALVIFAAPVLLAREALSQGQSLEWTKAKLGIQSQALQHATDRIADERRDERLAVASGLHDDVLPPLFKVHLLGQVLRQELSTGQLLAMEDDLPELLRATDEASTTIRSVIRNLRSSPLGAGGVAHTLKLLIRELEADANVTFEVDVEDVKATPVVELLAYQAARESLRNALKHSGASCIRVGLSRDGDDIRLEVEDNGSGFSQVTVDVVRHFGLALMQERIALAGGLLAVDTSPGRGTRIMVRLPSGDLTRQ